MTSAPTMCAPSNSPGFGVEDGFDEALRLTQRDGLAVADEGEAANFDLAALLPSPWLRSDPTDATCGWQ